MRNAVFSFASIYPPVQYLFVIIFTWGRSGVFEVSQIMLAGQIRCSGARRMPV